MRRSTYGVCRLLPKVSGRVLFSTACTARSDRKPRSNGIAEAFVKTLKRDDVQGTPLPDAETVLGLIANWVEDYKP